MHHKQAGHRGFTLIELMIVVVIIGVLAVVAGTAYRRYMDNGRTTEVMAMLAEIRAKEEAYKAEWNMYYGMTGAENPYSTMYPVLVVGSEPFHKPWAPANNTVWAYLGIQPGRNTLQCSYGVWAGPAGAGPGGGTHGGAIIVAPTAPWWYAMGVCDNDGNAGTAPAPVNA
jgi:prepilin-type N-terminal cleavage/methylation domain-containing protein